MERYDPTATVAEAAPRGTILPPPAVLAFLAAVLGRLPVLGGYWIRDDWRLLGAAAGVEGAAAGPARWFSRVFYWETMQPLWGSATDPWTWSRLLVFGAGAAAVVRLAGRCGLSAAGSLLAGLLFAASPLAFAPLYQAAGIQVLLGAVLALAAAERLLAGGGRNLLLAAAAGVPAVFSHECALGLPLLFAAAAIAGPRAETGRRLAAAAFLAAAAAWETHLLLGDSGLGSAATFAASPPQAGFGASLGLQGLWLACPWPVPPSGAAATAVAAGISFWTAWLVLAILVLRRGDRRQAALLACSLLALAPALAQGGARNPGPILAAAAPLALALAALLEPALAGMKRRPAAAAAALAVAFAAIAFAGAGHRIDRRDADGLPADPLVLETAVAWNAARTLADVPDGPWSRVVLLQSPGLHDSRAAAATLPGLPRPTLLYRSLGGRFGPALLAGDRWSIVWSTTLVDKTVDSLVLQDGGAAFNFWGPLPQALVYQCLTDIALGRFREARTGLTAAMKISQTRLPFFFDPGQMAVPVAAVERNADRFLEHLDAAGGDPRTAAALRETASQMLAACRADS